MTLSGHRARWVLCLCLKTGGRASSVNAVHRKADVEVGGYLPQPSGYSAGDGCQHTDCRRIYYPLLAAYSFLVVREVSLHLTQFTFLAPPLKLDFGERALFGINDPIDYEIKLDLLSTLLSQMSLETLAKIVLSHVRPRFDYTPHFDGRLLSAHLFQLVKRAVTSTATAPL